jgi:hypothetical protein
MREHNIEKDLNYLNGQAGTSAPFKSVPVMKLISLEKPQSRQELVYLIESYHTNPRNGIKSMGNLKDFARNLYEAQPQYFNEYRYTLEQCTDWMFDLFINRSLRGYVMEEKALETLQHELGSEYTVELAKGYLDEELRIDLLIYKGEDVICGVQVKPSSFKRMRESVKEMQSALSSKYHKDVLMYYYKHSSFMNNFLNTDSIVSKIKSITDEKQ